MKRLLVAASIALTLAGPAGAQNGVIHVTISGIEDNIPSSLNEFNRRWAVVVRQDGVYRGGKTECNQSRLCITTWMGGNGGGDEIDTAMLFVHTDGTIARALAFEDNRLHRVTVWDVGGVTHENYDKGAHRWVEDRAIRQGWPKHEDGL
jgi:hypothetical protein